MSSTTLPWDIDAVLPPACEQLSWAAKTPNALADLVSGDVLLWQRVSDLSPRPLELIVVWLHFLLPNQERSWALVELQRWNGDKQWSGEDVLDEDFREYISAIAERDFDASKSIQNGLSCRCQCYTSAPTNADISAFLDLCSFLNPWVDGVQELGDTIEDRIINWSAWMRHLGWEPSPEIVRQIGKYRAV